MASTPDHTTPVTPKGHFDRNQYGSALGGPVIIPKLFNGKKNKTFFFASYEGLRDTFAGSFFGTMPTALERQGNFSQTYDASGNLIVIYNPATTTVGSGTYSRTPVTGNLLSNIPGYVPNPIGQALLNLYPLPTPNLVGVGGSDQDNFFSNAPNTDQNNLFDIRIDHQFSEHNSIFGHITDFTNHINYSDYLRQRAFSRGRQRPHPRQEHHRGSHLGHQAKPDLRTSLLVGAQRVES